MLCYNSKESVGIFQHTKCGAKNLTCAGYLTQVYITLTLPFFYNIAFDVRILRESLGKRIVEITSLAVATPSPYSDHLLYQYQLLSSNLFHKLDNRSHKMFFLF